HATAPSALSTPPLHDALPICSRCDGSTPVSIASRVYGPWGRFRARAGEFGAQATCAGVAGSATAGAGAASPASRRGVTFATEPAENGRRLYHRCLEMAESSLIRPRRVGHKGAAH